MADKTLGFKVTDEMYDKTKLIIEASGISSKEWLEKAVALYEMNSIKQGSSDYTQDLNELEHHTTRIYELIVNMIQRSVYLKDHAVKEISEKLESKEAIISDFQQQIAKLKEELTHQKTQNAALQELETELTEKLKSSDVTLANNQALIAEYKEKNDTLSGLVAKYQAFAEENEQLKAEFAKAQADLIKELHAAESTTGNLQTELTELKKASAEDQKKQEDRLKLALERKDLEREKALVELERQQQAQVATLNKQHNEQLRNLYAELADLRKQNEEARLKHQQEIEQLKEEKKE